jgi:hypothetical protein
MRLDVFLKLTGTLIIHCFRLVVQSAVMEDPVHIIAETLSILVLIVGKFLLDGLHIDWILNNQRVIWNVLDQDWLSEWPD